MASSSGVVNGPRVTAPPDQAKNHLRLVPGYRILPKDLTSLTKILDSLDRISGDIRRSETWMEILSACFNAKFFRVAVDLRGFFLTFGEGGGRSLASKKSCVEGCLSAMAGEPLVENDLFVDRNLIDCLYGGGGQIGLLRQKDIQALAFNHPSMFKVIHNPKKRGHVFFPGENRSGPKLFSPAIESFLELSSPLDPIIREQSVLILPATHQSESVIGMVVVVNSPSRKIGKEFIEGLWQFANCLGSRFVL